MTPLSLANRRSVGLLIAAAVGAILIATLFPSGSELAPRWTTALVGGDDALAGVVQNLLLFVPLGFGLALAGLRGFRLVAVGTLLSLSVECAQQWIPGRDPSVGDVCFNTLGTALGGLVGRTAPLWFSPTPRRAAWLSLAAALVATATWLTTGWLFQPDGPATTYVVTLRPDLANRGLYPGSLLGATLGSPLPLRVVAVAGATPRRLSPLIALTDERGREMVLLSVDHADLALWFRTRGTDWRLDRPDWRARGALAAVAPGDTFTVAALRDAGGTCLALEARSHAERWCDRAYTLADGWKLIFDLARARPWLLDLLAASWIGGVLVPVGLWARRHWSSAVALLVAGGGLFAAPALTGLAPTPLPALLGALAGIGLGLLLQLLPPLDASLDVFLKPEFRGLVPPRA